MAHSEPPSTTPEAVPARPPAIVIRQIRDEDFDAIREIFIDGFPPPPNGDIEQFNAYIESSIKTDLGNAHATYIATGGNFWVATADVSDGQGPQVVGMVALEKKADGEGELRRMSVKREFRRFGIGKLLVSELESWAKAHEYRRISLWTGQVVTAAQAFYKASGYEKQREKSIPENPDFIIYEFVKEL